MSDSLKRTPLFEIQKQLGARMVEFGGWEMPVQYSSIVAEHLAVRSNVGILDLSHMGEIEIKGPGALPLIQRLITNNASKLSDGRILYSPMCTESGGIVDDLLVYRFNASRYMLVVNASNIDKDCDWLRAHNSNGVEISNVSDETVLVALQGKNALPILQALTDLDISAIDYYWFAQGKVDGIPALISRTGYTGEIGFELYMDTNGGEEVWHALHDATVDVGGSPVGLGARDTLRLEMKFCLYGNDIDETTTPLEAGLRWTVAFDKGDFIGANALTKQRESGIKRRLTGFKMLDRGIARSHYKVYHGDQPVGEVTSGAPSPSLGCNIGLAYLPIERSRRKTRIEVEIRGKRHPAKVVPTPFYKSSN
ncbi:MAG: glycine cleavage system aminomethyltransferase GcvT [Candidatus Poribacteria bacterium]|nr:glycine cleavage system aminomethyltransferase GcvT [Candidatus Poribacteria bacterium]